MKAPDRNWLCARPPTIRSSTLAPGRIEWRKLAHCWNLRAAGRVSNLSGRGARVSDRRHLEAPEALTALPVAARLTATSGATAAECC